MKGCDDKCKVPGPNRGACCDKPGCETRTVDFDTRAILTNPKALNNLGGHGPDKDANGKLTIDGGTLPREMRFPEAGSFIDRDNLNGVANAKIVFDVVITVITKSASGRTGGHYQPRNSDRVANAISVSVHTCTYAHMRTCTQILLLLICIY